MRHGVVAKTSNLDPTPTCRAGTEREKNQLIDELSLKDQQLQQVDTIIAELQDRITQSKRNATRRHVQRNEAQAALQKSVMDNQTMGQAIAQAKRSRLKNIREHPSRRGNGRLGKCCPQCGTA